MCVPNFIELLDVCLRYSNNWAYFLEGGVVPITRMINGYRFVGILLTSLVSCLIACR